MKKLAVCIGAALAACVGIVSLAGCKFSIKKIPGFGESDSDKKFQSLLRCLNEKDGEGLRALFAESKIEDDAAFDESVEALFDYYQGPHTSYLMRRYNAERNATSGMEFYRVSYDVPFGSSVYRMAVLWCAEDGGSANEGIWSYYIVKSADDPNRQDAYEGDGLWTTGINIGVTYGCDRPSPL